MFNQTILQETDLWEAWVEYDEFDPKVFGTLYIIGEIMIEPGTNIPSFSKSIGPENKLFLSLPPMPAGRGRRKEVLYSEPIRNLGQYSSILIYSGEDLLARFDEIEILI